MFVSYAGELKWNIIILWVRIRTAESAYDQLQKLYNQQISLTDGEKQETKANAPKKSVCLQTFPTNCVPKLVSLPIAENAP